MEKWGEMILLGWNSKRKEFGKFQILNDFINNSCCNLNDPIIPLNIRLSVKLKH